jgi:hypothetical protein
MCFAVAETLVEERRFSVPAKGGTIELRRISSCLGQLSPFLARDPGDFRPSRYDASPKTDGGHPPPSQFNRANEGERTVRRLRWSKSRPAKLAPIDSSHRPAPQPLATAMAQRSTQQPGTCNLLSSSHPSSSVCDEDLSARGHTQSCSSILFTCILTFFNPAPFQSSFPLLFLVPWNQLSLAIDRR